MDSLKLLGLANAGLVTLVVLQQIYFMRQIQKLVDKLMAKSFVEYHQVTAPPVPEKPKPQMPLGIPEDLRVLQELRLPY